MKRRQSDVLDTSSKKSKTGPSLKQLLQALPSLTPEELVELVHEANKHYSVWCDRVLERVPLDVWQAVLHWCTRRMVCGLSLTSNCQVLNLGCVSKQFSLLADQYCVEHFSHLCCSSDMFLRKFTALEHLKVQDRSISLETMKLLTNLKSLQIGSTTRSDLPSAITFLPNLTKLECLRMLSWCMLANIL